MPTRMEKFCFWCKQFVHSSGYFLWRTLFLYRKDAQFYVNYFHTTDRIRCDRNSVQAWQLRVNYAILCAQIAHYFACYVWPPQGEYNRMVYFDYIGLSHIPPIVNLQLCFVIGEMFYIFDVFYVQMVDNRAMSLLRQVMEEGDTSFTLTGKPVQQRTFRVLHIYQPFLVLVEMWCLCETAILLRRLDLTSMLNWTGLLHLTIMLAGVVTLFGCLILFGYILSFWAAFAVFTSSIVFERLRWCEEMVNKNFGNNFHDVRANKRRLRALNAFWWEHGQTLRFFFSHHRELGNLLLGFALVNTPCSSIILLTTLINHHHPLVILLFMITFVLVQISVIFAVHWLAASYSKRIHSPGKPAMRLLMTTRMGPRWRIKLTLYVHNLIAPKQYGITYGSTGLVTMMAFFKFLMLYSEVNMYNLTYIWRSMKQQQHST